MNQDTIKQRLRYEKLSDIAAHRAAGTHSEQPSREALEDHPSSLGQTLCMGPYSGSFSATGEPHEPRHDQRPTPRSSFADRPA